MSLPGCVFLGCVLPGCRFSGLCLSGLCPSTEKGFSTIIETGYFLLIGHPQLIFSWPLLALLVPDTSDTQCNLWNQKETSWANARVKLHPQVHFGPQKITKYYTKYYPTIKKIVLLLQPLYRDDTLSVLRTIPRQADICKKEVFKIFQKMIHP